MGRPILDSIDRLEEALGECKTAFTEKGLEIEEPLAVNDLASNISAIQGGKDLEERVSVIESDYLKSSDIELATDEDITALFEV